METTSRFNPQVAQYRSAVEADLAAICRLGEAVNAIHHSAVPHIFAGAGAPDRDATQWKASICSESAHTFVAELSGQLVGFVTASIVTESNTLLMPLRFGRVGSVSVAETARGQGVGTELMRCAHAWVEERGGHEVRLIVWAFNEPALRLYQELGYEIRSLNLAKMLVSND